MQVRQHPLRRNEPNDCAYGGSGRCRVFQHQGRRARPDPSMLMLAHVRVRQGSEHDSPGIERCHDPPVGLLLFDSGLGLCWLAGRDAIGPWHADLQEEVFGVSTASRAHVELVGDPRHGGGRLPDMEAQHEMDASGCNDAKDYVGGCPLGGPHCGRAVSQQSFDDADDLSVCGGSRRGHFFFLGGLSLLGWCSSIPVSCCGGDGEETPESPALVHFWRRSAPPEPSSLVGTVSKALSRSGRFVRAGVLCMSLDIFCVAGGCIYRGGRFASRGGLNRCDSNTQKYCKAFCAHMCNIRCEHIRCFP